MYLLTFPALFLSPFHRFARLAANFTTFFARHFYENRKNNPTKTRKKSIFWLIFAT